MCNIPRSTHDVVLYIAASMISFFTLNWFLDYLPVPAKYADRSRRHKWRNVVGSTVHAAIAAVGGTSGIYYTPQLLEDHVYTHSAIIRLFVAISADFNYLHTGYFIYDFIDIAMYGKLQESWPVLTHHTLTGIWALAVSYTGKWHGYTAITMLIEINGPFLHLRLILLMWGVSKQSLVFRINAVINVATYIVFRLGIFGYDTCWLFGHRAEVGGFLVPCLCVVLLVLNMMLFYRLISKDYLSPKQDWSGSKPQPVDEREDLVVG